MVARPKVWCPSCGGYHFVGSKAHRQCGARPGRRVSPPPSPVDGPPAGRPEDLPGEKWFVYEGASHPMDGDCVVGALPRATNRDASVVHSESLVQGCRFYLGDEDMRFERSCLERTAFSGWMSCRDSMVDGGMWRESSLSGVRATGDPLVSDSSLEGCQVHRQGGAGPMRIHDSSLASLAVSGGRISIRASSLTYGPHEGQPGSGVVSNVGSGVVSLEQVSSTREGDPGGLSVAASRGASVHVRETRIGGVVSLVADGCDGESIIVQDCHLGNISVAASGSFRAERSIIASGSGRVMVSVGERATLVLDGALITDPGDVVEWRDEGVLRGWAYRALPPEGSESPVVTVRDVRGEKVADIDSCDVVSWLMTDPDGPSEEAAVSRLVGSGVLFGASRELSDTERRLVSGRR